MCNYLGIMLKFIYEALLKCEAKSIPFLSLLPSTPFAAHNMIPCHNWFYEIKYEVSKMCSMSVCPKLFDLFFFK